MNPLSLPREAYNPWRDLQQRAKVMRLLHEKYKIKKDTCIQLKKAVELKP